jgi:hypothetical protein
MALTLFTLKKDLFMNQNNANRPEQGGSGSAEQTSRSREEQFTKTNLSENEKENIASAIGEDSSSVTTIDELGHNSGRDDAAGGAGDRMEETSSNEETDKF